MKDRCYSEIRMMHEEKLNELHKIYKLAQALERADDSSQPAGLSFSEMMADLKKV